MYIIFMILYISLSSTENVNINLTYEIQMFTNTGKCSFFLLFSSFLVSQCRSCVPKYISFEIVHKGKKQKGALFMLLCSVGD